MSETMTLRVVTPTGVALETAATRIVAVSPVGAFGMLPRHVDYVTELIPGVPIHDDEGGEERFLGVNSGTLVKCGAEVTVATRDAIPGDDLSALERRVAETFGRIDDRERAARGALARLEAGLVRRFFDLGRETSP